MKELSKDTIQVVMEMGFSFVIRKDLDHVEPEILVKGRDNEIIGHACTINYEDLIDVSPYSRSLVLARALRRMADMLETKYEQGVLPIEFPDSSAEPVNQETGNETEN